MSKPSRLGATFAERAAAARGDKDFTPPTPEHQVPEGNSTFASRAKAAGKASSRTKAVEAETDGAENKAVAKKSASKK